MSLTPPSAAHPDAFSHASVLAPEVAKALEPLAEAERPLRLVDGTLGGGGHAAFLLAAFPQATLLGIDRDPNALQAAQKRLSDFSGRFHLRQGPFAALPDYLQELDWHEAGIDGLVVDLGVSSHQLDTAERGFSFRFDGPLDMRMGPSATQTAAALIDETAESALADIIRNFGEERFARRVARKLKATLPTTTFALADAVRSVLPPHHGKGIDPATRTFQALRIAVNDELSQLDALLASLPQVLRPGGIFAGISFHSLEDRRVKQALRQFVHPCICPHNLPVCACNRKPSFELVGPQPHKATALECAANPRARSARLRVARRVAA